MKTKSVKEPIRKKWIWIVLFINVVLIVPWYFPKGAVEPFVLGFPLWAFISTFFTLIMGAYLSWLCISQWNIVEEEEENGKRKEDVKHG
jgi:hypothetical protein